jgi:hypothetical protein
LKETIEKMNNREKELQQRISSLNNKKVTLMSHLNEAYDNGVRAGLDQFQKSIPYLIQLMPNPYLALSRRLLTRFIVERQK